MIPILLAAVAAVASLTTVLLSLRILSHLERQGKAMATALDDLTAQVAANTDLENSAIQLIQGLAGQIAAAGDPARVQELAARLKMSAAALAAAITANTPAAPPPPPAS